MSKKKRRVRDQDSLPLESGLPGAVAVSAAVSEAVVAGASVDPSADQAASVSAIDAGRVPDCGALPVAVVTSAADSRSESPTASALSSVAVDLADDAAGDLVMLGSRLRAARESSDWSREELASKARIPLAAIANIEAGNVAALGAVIYARGFMRSYARAVGVADDVVDAALHGHQVEEPVLVAANPTGLGDRFAARYTNPLVYGLLTLVVVVPLVFLAAPKTSREAAPAFSPLDASVPTVDARLRDDSAVAEPQTPGQSSVASYAGPPVTASVAPVMASIAPMPAAVASPRPAGSRVLVLRVSEPSWIELTAADGRRLEYSQLQAGAAREYVVDGGADLVVGNVPAVVATLNGEAVDLNAVANRNVARLRIGDATPPAGQ